jgi:hypothetical protein
MDVHRTHHLSYTTENKTKKDFRSVTAGMVHVEPLEEKKIRDGLEVFLQIRLDGIRSALKFRLFFIPVFSLRKG